MANSDRPRGFAPHGKVLRASVYEAGAAIYPGDMVKLSSDGQIDPVSAGDPILGCALGYAAAAGDKVLVCDDPKQKYVVQADETEISAQSLVGNVADVVATAANTTYKCSRHELDSSDAGTTTAQLIILGIEARPDNAFGAQVDVICMINEDQFVSGNTTPFAGV